MRLLILRLRDIEAAEAGHIADYLRIDRLISEARRRLRGGRRVGSGYASEQATEKTCCMSRLSGLLGLLLQLGHLRFRLIKRDVLHEHRLRQDVERVRVRAKRAIQQRFCIRILFLSCVWFIRSLSELRSCSSWGVKGFNLRRPAICANMPPLMIETRSRRQSCTAGYRVRANSSLVQCHVNRLGNIDLKPISAFARMAGLPDYAIEWHFYNFD